MMKYYTKDNIDEYLDLFKISKLKKFSKKKIKYYNIPATFDIETTSAYINLDTNEIIEAHDFVKIKEAKNGKSDDTFCFESWEKISWMYVWQVSINDYLYMGRTWDDFLFLKNKLIEKFNLSEELYLIFYVRNLEYEFQYVKHYFNFINIFASKPHAVIYARSNDGFELRCSYFLAGCNLETTGKNLLKYKAEKQTGKLDYSKIRNSKTPLTEDEIDYCLYDVIVDSNFIKESMEDEPNDSILKMPLTKTGYVRRYVKNYVMTARFHKLYLKKVQQFQMSMKKYQQLKRCFAGGFTHSNALNTGVTFENVFSQDLKSSYPASLALEKYPMSKGRLYKPTSFKDFIDHLKVYACIFDITFYDIEMKPDVYENIISTSKCFSLEGEVENNGRIVKAKKLITTITEIDYFNICQFYNFRSVKIANMTIYRKDYLPKELIECILHFFKNKTTLKNVAGKEKEYMILKSMLNSIFGMMVTDPIKPIIELIDDIWQTSYENIEESLNKYNTKYDRFLVYEWGIYCTAYARRNIFSGIKELKSDYIYSDTDSLKYTNHESHIEFFEKYNKMIISKIERICKRYNFDIEDFMPKDPDGNIQILGQFDLECMYTRFKTLGAKRYMYELDNEVNITVSGLNKEKAMPYLLKQAKEKNMDVFELFNDDLFVAGEYSGKLLHTYLDKKMEFDCVDYLGNKDHIIALSAVHLEPSSYSLSLADKYKRYLEHIKTLYRKG